MSGVPLSFKKKAQSSPAGSPRPPPRERPTPSSAASTAARFFSNRRRHTRYWRDWSSDVCSSDLTTDISLQPVIVLENLVKFFGRFAALRDISDSLAPVRLYVVVGDNGAGKSTLLRVVAGLMQPSQGSVTLLGAKTAREVAHRIGYMGHAPLLYDELSGMENLDRK